jgi:alpha-1,3-glucosyltransferase
MAMANPSPHKPRRRGKKIGDGYDEKPQRVARTEALVRTPSFPLAAFLWPARSSSTQWEVLPSILMVVGLFRWAAGLWGYSGKLHLE